MLPVTRANLDHICCICLLDIRPSVFSQKVYDVKKEHNVSKMLKLSAHITILKNPINQKYINEYCRKICEVCFVKTQYSYFFREKIMASTAALKELLESGDLNENDIERLQFFCRICINRQKATNNIKTLNMMHLQWLKNCSGIRFTSLTDTEAFRIKEGTNINEIALIDDTNFPRQLCSSCFKKLQNVEEFRISSTQSFEYMISVMGDASTPEDYLVRQEVKQFKENVVWLKVPNARPVSVEINPAKQDCATLETVDMKHNVQDDCSIDIGQYQMHDICSDMEPMINTLEYSNINELNDDNYDEFMELMDDRPHSDSSSEDLFNLHFNNNETKECSDDSANKNEKLRAKKSKQVRDLYTAWPDFFYPPLSF